MAKKVGRGKAKAKDAKAKAKAKSKKKAQRQAAPKPSAPKREQFKEGTEGHKEEADRQIKIAREEPHNLTTVPAILKFITNKKSNLGQKPLFYGDRAKSKRLDHYIRGVLRATGGAAGIGPPTGVASWHRETHFGECECSEIVDAVVHDDGSDASDAVEPEKVLCVRSLRGRVLTYEPGWRRDSIRVAPEATREPLARRRFYNEHGRAPTDEELARCAAAIPLADCVEEALRWMEVEARAAGCLHDDHKGEEDDIADPLMKDSVKAEIAVRKALRKLKRDVPRIMGGGNRQIGPGQRLRGDGRIEVRYFIEGVAHYEDFANDAEGRTLADQFVLEHCGRAVRLAQLRANQATRERDPTAPLPFATGAAAVQTMQGGAAVMPTAGSNWATAEPRRVVPAATRPSRAAAPSLRGSSCDSTPSPPPPPASPASLLPPASPSSTQKVKDKKAKRHRPVESDDSDDAALLPVQALEPSLRGRTSAADARPRRGRSRAAHSPAASPRRNPRRGADDAPAPAAAPTRVLRGRGVERAPRTGRVASAPAPKAGQKRGRGGAARPETNASPPRSMSVDAPRQHLGVPFTEPPTVDPKYETYVNRLRDHGGKYDLKATLEFQPILERVEKLHVSVCAAFHVGIAENWGLKVPCSRNEVFGMTTDDERVILIHYRAQKLAVDERIDYLNYEILDAPDGPGRDLIQKIYGCGKRLTDRQYDAVRRLWVVDTILSPVELVLEALVLRPRTFSRHWKGRRDRTQMKRYTGAKRVELVNEAIHGRTKMHMHRELAGA